MPHPELGNIVSTQTVLMAEDIASLVVLVRYGKSKNTFYIEGSDGYCSFQGTKRRQRREFLSWNAFQLLLLQ